jgi:hypothetical protein
MQREEQIDAPSDLQAVVVVRTSVESMLNNKTPVVGTRVMVVKES